MNFALALRRRRVENQQRQIGAAFHGKRGELQIERAHLRMVNALIAFSVAGDVMALPETGELNALLRELSDQLVSFRRRPHPGDVGAKSVDDKLPHRLPVLQRAACFRSGKQATQYVALRQR